MKVIVLAVLSQLQIESYALNLGLCNRTLGLESGDILDTALSASSAFDDHSTGPQNARLNQDRHGGAWCPKPAISENVKEWLQVDLNHGHIITGIITQGRYGKGKGQEFLQQFLIEYRHLEMGRANTWMVYSDKNGKQIFDANKDTVTPVFTTFDPPLFADQIRIIPFSVHPRIICLRFELHGCKDESDILSYTCPPPDLPGSLSIDVNERKDRWREADGRGILADGNLGEDVMGLKEVPSYDQGWFGWKRRGSKPIQLMFEFNSQRNFSKIDIYASNRFDLNIMVFKRASVSFSVGGRHFLGEKVTFEYMPDKALQESRHILIGINGGGRVGRFVKLNLVFEDVWMLISEITFDSIEVTQELEVENPEKFTMETSTEEVLQTTSTETEAAVKEIEQVEHPTDHGMYMEILIGVLTAVTLLLLFLFIAIIVYSRRQKFLHSPTSRSLNPFPVQINMKDLLMNLSPSSHAHLSAASSSSPPNITTNPNYNENDTATTSFYEPFIPPQSQFTDPQVLDQDLRTKWHSTGHMTTNHNFRTSLTNGNSVAEYASVDIQNLTSTGSGNGPTAPMNSSLTNIHHYRSLQGSSSAFGGAPNQQQILAPGLTLATTTNGTKLKRASPQVYNLGNYFPRVSSEPPQRKSYNTTRDLKESSPLAQTLWNLTASVHTFCKQTPASVSLEEIPRSQLRPKESLGRGCRGEVIMCDLETAYSNVPQLVAVRSSSPSTSPTGSSPGASGSDREDFLRESRLLATLTHPHVAKLLGVCTTEEPYCFVMEHGAHGDVYNYLRQMQTDGNVAFGEGVSYNRLLDIMAQTASGMKYLEGCHIVHKDLAARNLILTENNVVKISDLSMGISLFNSDYSDVRGRNNAPIRWQAWETILLGRLATSSNVWSFGITCWEILTLCRQRPYSLLTDIEVVQNAEHIYYNDSMQLELVKPENCESEVWDLLEECWSRDEKMRPNFAEINMFLKRKSLTFDVEV